MKIHLSKPRTLKQLRASPASEMEMTSMALTVGHLENMVKARLPNMYSMNLEP